MRTWLRSVLREPHVDGAPARVWRDVVLVGAAEIGAIVEAILRPHLPWRWATLAIALVVLPALAWRRTHPLLVLAVSFGTMAGFSVAALVTGLDREAGLNTMAVLLLSLYALCRWASGRDVLAGLAVVVPTVVLGFVANPAKPSDVVGGVIVLGITVASASAVRFRVRARQREVEQVRLVEREQLARDLHDTVAHHVSAIAIRAQAGIATAPARPEAALEALQLISTEASRTLAEMRAMVGVLRRDGRADLAPLPSLADVDRLAQHVPGSLRVDVSIDPDAVIGTAPAVATAVYRIAQEAVTNAQRHARNATRVVVAVAGANGSVTLRVSDDGDPVDLRRAGEGYGLRGMAERAELLGGACSASPGRPRGWVVEAALPRAGGQ